MTTTLTKKKLLPRKRASRPAGWNLRRVGGLRILEAPVFAALDWLVHGFSTRLAGVSELATSDGAPSNMHDRVLNLGFTDWDSRARVLDNRKKFFHAIGADKLRAVTLRQIHSDAAHRVDSSNAGAKDAPQGDALFTRDPGFLLAVQTADCIPILLADTKLHAIAAIHAGWRGTLSRIAAKTLGRMQMEFGTRPEDVVAALGPGIGRCCYEVGSEVARDFDAQFSNAREWFDGPFEALASGENDPNWLPWLTMKPPGHPPPPLRVHLDLIAANHAILASAGIPAPQMSASGFCTACRTDLLFSYRRERPTGRMMATIGMM
ncbi:MAG TPA: peptidoglycan editing factor PgeF [Candidatus Acidoferrales bacterium]|jgi:YfiH family protein|nr:peptidoglycan editing factor PgeF [Candidatus Acidoferrales bacterium]